MALKDKQTIEVGDVLFDVNPEDEWMQVRIGKETARIKRIDLWAMVFAISGPNEQEKMMPVRQTEMMTYERVHAVRAKKDINKGDVLKFHCTVNVPLTVVDGLKGMINEKPKSTFLL